MRWMQLSNGWSRAVHALERQLSSGPLRELADSLCKFATRQSLRWMVWRAGLTCIVAHLGSTEQLGSVFDSSCSIIGVESCSTLQQRLNTVHPVTRACYRVTAPVVDSTSIKVGTSGSLA